MARLRLLPSLERMQRPPFFTIPIIPCLLALIGVFSVFSIVTFLCGSHGASKLSRRNKEKTVQLGGKKSISKLQSNMSSKALLMLKVVSWRKVQDDDAEEEINDGDDDQEAVWRKKIIMGEKCRPLDFSGNILYDSNGNLLPTSARHDHTKNNKLVVSSG